jgi:hypothetical protein
LEIGLREGIKVDMATDPWVRRCIGIAVVIVAVAVLVLALPPLVTAIRWW